MSGGGSSSFTNTIIELPTYTQALIFLFFLLVSLAFEKLIRLAKSCLLRRGKWGLVEVLNKLVLEITLLGFVSVLLLTFQDSLDTLCVGYSQSMWTWNWLSNIDGCACCLEDTGINVCSQIQQGCAFNATTREGFCGCSDGGDDSYSGADNGTCMEYSALESLYQMGLVPRLFGASSPDECDAVCTALANATANGTVGAMQRFFAGLDGFYSSGRRLLSNSTSYGAGNASADVDSADEGVTVDHVLSKPEVFRCTGGMVTTTCEEGKVPAVPSNAMHQIHLWIFVIAMLHVTTACVMMLLGGLRIRQWRRWQRLDAETAAAAAAAQAVLPGGDSAAGSAASDSQGGASPPAAGAAPPSRGEPGGPEALAPAEASGGSGSKSGEPGSACTDSLQELGLGLGGVTTPGAVQTLPPEPQGRRNAVQQLRRQWLHRDTRIVRSRVRATEYIIIGLQSLWQTLWLNMISRRDFLCMRESYIKAHRPAEPFDFVDHLLASMEHRGADIVGLSLEMWVVAILIILLSGITALSLLVFLCLIVGLMLLCNAVLVGRVRYINRGGHANPLKRRRLPWLTLELLRVPLRMVLFLDAFTYSNKVFFAWQFGPHSCFFTMDTAFFNIGPSVPWWVALIVSVVILLYLSLNTFPAYVICLQMEAPDQEDEGLVQALAASLGYSQPGPEIRSKLSQRVMGFVQAQASQRALGRSSSLGELRREVDRLGRLIKEKEHLESGV